MPSLVVDTAKDEEFHLRWPTAQGTDPFEIEKVATKRPSEEKFSLSLTCFQVGALLTKVSALSLVDHKARGRIARFRFFCPLHNGYLES